MRVRQGPSLPVQGCSAQTGESRYLSNFKSQGLCLRPRHACMKLLSSFLLSPLPHCCPLCSLCSQPGCPHLGLLELCSVPNSYTLCESLLLQTHGRKACLFHYQSPGVDPILSKFSAPEPGCGNLDTTIRKKGKKKRKKEKNRRWWWWGMAWSSWLGK